jgi:hypothetical protein
MWPIGIIVQLTTIEVGMSWLLYPQRDDIPEGAGSVGAHRAASLGALRAGGRRPGHARQEHAGQ